MSKKLLITEKPSVAMEFAKALKIIANRKNGYIESEEWIITWCVGHLVTMSYPEKYDEKLKFWRLDTLPFIPQEWKYEIIPNVQNQFNIIQNLMQREDIGMNEDEGVMYPKSEQSQYATMYGFYDSGLEDVGLIVSYNYGDNCIDYLVKNGVIETITLMPMIY